MSIGVSSAGKPLPEHTREPLPEHTREPLPDHTAGPLLASATNLTVDPSLPIAAHQAEIAALIMGHQVVIVAGETGSGKTTQLPKIVLALGRGSIGHTQPRRIAARSVATRLAAETGTQLGDLVGYQVRFVAETSQQTRLKVMTDGILLAEIAHDKQLRRYDTIIIDEAHERSLNIDFLLGYLKQLLPKRPELKVIITSATIDTARFAAHFWDAPVVEVSGRGYPIEVRYDPVGDKDQAEAIVAALRTLPPDYDTLVFLAGEREIRDAATAVEAAHLKDTTVLPLFARLTLAEQSRVFSAHEGRRVVLATNVAETSLTVPGIRAVIDPGFARISRYSSRTKVQRLPIEPVSQASANQRAGRCGRVAPGVCVRLYTEDDYLARPAFTEPEILRTNLASVILAMIQARLGDVAGFPFLDAPDARHVADGVRLLTELGAIVAKPKGMELTKTGRQLAQLPIDPALARVVVAGGDRGCLREAIVVASALSIQDVRERPLDHREVADALHARFGSDAALSQAGAPALPEPDTGPARITVHTGWGDYKGGGRRPGETPAPEGDVGAWLRLWDYLGELQRDLGNSQFRKRCAAEFISYARVREWQDLVSQLRGVTKGMKLHANARPAAPEQVVKAVMSGFLSHIGAIQPVPEGKPRRGPREYLGARGARFAIAPDSVMAHRAPPLVLAVELVETSRLWAHGVAEVAPEWVEDVAAQFIKSQFWQPFFSEASREVLVHERTSLFGVPLATDRLVDYAGVDASKARAIFIQSGLVEGLLVAPPGTALAGVLAHNRQQMSIVDGWEVKTRRRDLQVGDFVMAAWFDARLPGGITSGAALEAWLLDDPGKLLLSVDDLLAASPPEPEDYPDVWVAGPASLGLDYHFEPGASLDGVTVDVPLSALADLADAPFTWGVPGTRLDLAIALIRGLPKPQRRHVVPAQEFARRALIWLAEHGEDHTRPFSDELSRALTALTGEPILDWNSEVVPEHLRPLFRVHDGASTHTSRDLGVLQEQLGRQTHAVLSQASTHRVGTTWVFDHLAEQVILKRGDIEVPAFPALQDAATSVREVFAATMAQGRRVHRGGIGRLVALALPNPANGIVAHLSSANLAMLATGPYDSVSALLADARDAAIGSLIPDAWKIRDGASFDALVAEVRVDQAQAMSHVVDLAATILARYDAVTTRLARFSGFELVRDARDQLDDLVFEGFLRAIPTEWLRRLPIWLDGISRRLDGALANLARDSVRQGELAPVLCAYDALVAAHPEPGDEIDRLGYLIEELRLQLFAQPLRPVQTVSVKRILAAIAEAGTA